MHSAHIRKEITQDGSATYVMQSVSEHCRNTAKYAGEALKAIGLEKTAYLAGLLHDCGKETSAFKSYLEDSVIGNKLVKRGSVKHSFVGMHYILSKRVNGDDYRNLAMELIAYAIGAHHCLFDCVKYNKESAFDSQLDEKDKAYIDEALNNYFLECSSEEEIEQLLNEAIAEIKKVIDHIIAIDTEETDKCEKPFYYGLLCRLITSAVIYGDRKDTSEFCKNKLGNSASLDWNNVIEKFNAYISSLQNKHTVDPERKEISQACAEAAKKEGGIYRLNLPTGSGKTLSSLRYALEHARLYHKKRIIFVMPLLSIIEQNAKEIRKAIQDDSIILEHHSNVVNEEASDSDRLEKRELLTQPWDKPIIITTLVQLLNTLYSDKTSSIKRFASLTNSVIIFDEVQTVPNNMLTLFNLAVNFISEICHATVILCSATQPCFEKAEHKMLGKVKNLITLPARTLNVFKRVKLVDKGAMTMEELTEFALEIIARGKSLLVVCNTKKEAAELFLNIKAGMNVSIPIYHLSAAMCTAHREAVIKEMKSRLCAENPLQTICISTQVMEAGVDISFNCVIRLQAGMDNVVQAVGRENRNGENNNLELAYIVKLIDEKLNLLPEIERAKIATDSLLQAAKIDSKYDDLMSQASIDYYYKQLYDKMNFGYQSLYVNQLNTSIYKLLSAIGEAMPSILSQKFKTAGENFKVFADNTTEVIVPYGKGKEIITELASEKAKNDLNYAAEKIQEATGYTVSCYNYQLEALNNNNAVNYYDDFGIYTLVDSSYYDENLGLVLNAVGGAGFGE